MGSLESITSLLHQIAPSPPMSQVFQTQAASVDYLHPRIPSPVGFPSGPQKIRRDMNQAMNIGEPAIIATGCFGGTRRPT